MKGQRFVYWQDGEFWLGYLEGFPDYMTQGKSLDDLKEYLRDLQADLTSGQIPAASRSPRIMGADDAEWRAASYEQFLREDPPEDSAYDRNQSA
jgi:hypothetical protein